MKRAVDFADPSDVRAWLGGLSVQLEELRSIGREACRSRRRRVLSRAETMRHMREVEEVVGAYLDAAERGLGPMQIITVPPTDRPPPAV